METTCDFYKSQTMTKERTKLKRVEGNPNLKIKQTNTSYKENE